MAKERILVVEDDEDILELLRYNLAKEGYQVATAKTGEDGLKEAVASPPDLICLDLMLPSIDGLEVCSRLKQDHRTQAVSVIMVTAKGEEPDIVGAGAGRRRLCTVQSAGAARAGAGGAAAASGPRPRKPIRFTFRIW